MKFISFNKSGGSSFVTVSLFELLLEEYSNKDLSVSLADKTIIEHCTFVIHAFRISREK